MFAYEGFHGDRRAEKVCGRSSVFSMKVALGFYLGLQLGFYLRLGLDLALDLWLRFEFS